MMGFTFIKLLRKLISLEIEKWIIAPQPLTRVRAGHQNGEEFRRHSLVSRSKRFMFLKVFGQGTWRRFAVTATLFTRNAISSYIFISKIFSILLICGSEIF